MSKAEFQGNSGEQSWQKLVKTNKQIFMVLNGHFHDNDGERHQVSYNAAGLPVYEMIANYQQYANGGDGYMRLIQFDPANARINVKTYSPKLGTYKTDWDSQFSFSVDLYKRFGERTSSTQDSIDLTSTSEATPAMPTEAPTLIVETPVMIETEQPTDTPVSTLPAAPQAAPNPIRIWLPIMTQ